MATYFVNPATGTDDDAAGRGATWEDPYATVIWAMRGRASGVGMAKNDVVVCAATATETISTATFGIIDENEPDEPWALISSTVGSGAAISYSAGFTVQRTGSSDALNIYGAASIYGVTFKTTGSSGYVYCSVGGTTLQGPVRMYGCTVQTYGGLFLTYNDSAPTLIANSCTFQPGQSANPTTAMLTIAGMGGYVELNNCTVSAANGHASTNYLLSVTGKPGSVRLNGCNVSSLDETVRLLYHSTNNSGEVRFSGCTLPASWVTTGISIPSSTARLLVERSDGSARTQTAAGVRLYATNAGTLAHDTATYRTNGATDGDDLYSWKFTGDATYCSYHNPLVSPPITAWLDGDGVTSHDITVHFGSDTTLTDADVWFDLLYPAESTSHQDGYVTTRRAAGAAGAEYSSGDAWTGTEADNTYAETFSVTPDFPGPITLRVYVATDADDIYVCPNLEIV